MSLRGLSTSIPGATGGSGRTSGRREAVVPRIPEPDPLAGSGSAEAAPSTALLRCSFASLSFASHTWRGGVSYILH